MLLGCLLAWCRTALVQGAGVLADYETTLLGKVVHGRLLIA